MVSRLDREVSDLVAASRDNAEHIASVRRSAKHLKVAAAALERELSISEQRVAALETL
jgi:hypothetical protein